MLIIIIHAIVETYDTVTTLCVGRSIFIETI